MAQGVFQSENCGEFQSSLCNCFTKITWNASVSSSHFALTSLTQDRYRAIGVSDLKMRDFWRVSHFCVKELAAYAFGHFLIERPPPYSLQLFRSNLPHHNVSVPSCASVVSAPTDTLSIKYEVLCYPQHWVREALSLCSSELLADCRR